MYYSDHVQLICSNSFTLFAFISSFFIALIDCSVDTLQRLTPLMLSKRLSAADSTRAIGYVGQGFITGLKHRLKRTTSPVIAEMGQDRRATEDHGALTARRCSVGQTNCFLRTNEQTYSQDWFGIICVFLALAQMSIRRCKLTQWP